MVLDQQTKLRALADGELPSDQKCHDLPYCNTADGSGLGRSHRNLIFPFWGVILPELLQPLNRRPTAKLGSLGTPMTVSSGIYKEKIQSSAPDMEVKSLACPKFNLFSGIKRVGIQCDQKGGLWNPKTTSWKGWYLSWDAPIIPFKNWSFKCDGTDVKLIDSGECVRIFRLIKLFWAQ